MFDPSTNIDDSQSEQGSSTQNMSGNNTHNAAMVWSERRFNAGIHPTSFKKAHILNHFLNSKNVSCMLLFALCFNMNIPDHITEGDDQHRSKKQKRGPYVPPLVSTPKQTHKQTQQQVLAELSGALKSLSKNDSQAGTHPSS